MRRRPSRLLQILLPPCIALAVATTLYTTHYLAAYENRLYDLHYLLRGHEPSRPDDVVLVAIDDASIERAGSWPWPRERFARLLARIKEGSPRVIGLDLLVDLPEEARGDGPRARRRVEPGSGIMRAVGSSGDDALAAVLDTAPPVVLPLVLGRESEDGERAVLIRPLPRFVSSHTISAAVNMEPDHTDARVRRWQPDPGGGYRSFPVAIIAAAEGIGEEALVSNPGEFRIGRHRVPLEGGQALINFKGSRIDAISAADVMEDFFAPELFFKDRVVLVGRTDVACKDFLNTSVPGAALFETEYLAGVEIWKETLDSVLQDRSLRAPPLVPILVGIFLAAIVLSGLMLRWPKMSSVLLVTWLASWLVLTHVAFRQSQTRIPVMPGVMTFYFTSILSFIRLFLAQNRMKSLLTAAFESYVSPHVLSQLIDHKIELAVGGRRKTLSILHAGLDGFTSFSERQSAEDVVGFLKTYLVEMNQVILDHGGIIEAHSGDGILAWFGDIGDAGDHAEHAVTAALEMQARMGRLELPEGSGLGLRVGVHTGSVVVGNVGSDRHFRYTVVGRSVNLVRKLESSCAPGAVLISEDCWKAIPEGATQFAVEPVVVPDLRADISVLRVKPLS